MRKLVVCLTLLFIFFELKAEDPTLLWINRGSEIKINSFAPAKNGKNCYYNVSIRKDGIENQSILIADIKSGNIIDSFRVKAKFNLMDVSANEKYLVGAVDWGNTIEIVDLVNKKTLRFDMAESDNIMFWMISDITFTLDDKSYIVKESSNKKVQKFDIETGDNSFIDCGGDTTKWAFFTQGSKFIGVVRTDTAVTIISSENNEEICRIKLDHFPETISISSDEKYFLTGFDSTDDRNNIKLFEIKTGKLVNEYRSRFKNAEPKFASDNKHFIVGTFPDNGVEIMDIDNNLPTQYVECYYSSNFQDCVPSDTLFCGYNSRNNIFEYRSINSGEIVSTFSLGSEEGMANISCLKIPSKSNLIFTSNNKGKIKSYNSFTGKERLNFNAHNSRISNFDISPDGNYLITCSDDDTVKLWNIEDKLFPFLAKKVITGKKFNAVAFSPDGKFIAAGGNKTGIYYFKTDDMSFQTLDSIQYNILSLAFSPDEKKMCYGTGEKDLVILRKENDIYVRETSFKADFSASDAWGGLSSVCYSEDGSKIASTSGEWRIHIWNTSNYINTVTLYPAGTQSKSSFIKSALFANKNKWVISGDGGANIKIFDLQSGSVIWRNDTILKPKGTSNSVTSLSLSDDRNYLAVGAEDGSLLLYYLSPLYNTIEDYIADAFQISPNPAMDFIEINIPVRVQLAVPNKIEIYDIMGERIQTTPSTSLPPLQTEGELKIDISGFMPGVYFVKIGDWVQRFVKM